MSLSQRSSGAELFCLRSSTLSDVFVQPQRRSRLSVSASCLQPPQWRRAGWHWPHWDDLRVHSHGGLLHSEPPECRSRHFLVLPVGGAGCSAINPAFIQEVPLVVRHPPAVNATYGDTWPASPYLASYLAMLTQASGVTLESWWFPLAWLRPESISSTAWSQRLDEKGEKSPTSSLRWLITSRTRHREPFHTCWMEKSFKNKKVTFYFFILFFF